MLPCTDYQDEEYIERYPIYTRTTATEHSRQHETGTPRDAITKHCTPTQFAAQLDKGHSPKVIINYKVVDSSKIFLRLISLSSHRSAA